MRVLIVGGSGFIGSAIAQAAHAVGHDLLLLNRQERVPSAQAAFPTRQGDATEPEALRQVLADWQPEAVIHTVAYGPDDVALLRPLLAGSGIQLLVLSSMDVHAHFQAINEGREGGPWPVDEGAPLVARPFYLRGLLPGPKGERYDKVQLEAGLLEAHREDGLWLTLFRLPMVYGPGDRNAAGRHGGLMLRLMHPEHPFVMGQAEQGQILSYGHVANVAAGVVHALGRRDVAGGVYHLGDRQHRSQRAWLEGYARVAGLPLPRLHLLPDAWLHPGPEAAQAPPVHFLADCEAYARDTGFEAPLSWDEALQATWTWAQGVPEATLHPPIDWAHEARLLAAWEAATAKLPAPPKAP